MLELLFVSLENTSMEAVADSLSFATAGGKKPEGIQQALAAAKNYLQQ